MAARSISFKAHVAFALILILATLNRNSSITLVLLYGLLMVRTRRDIWLFLGYGLLWASVYGYLLLTRHPAYVMVTLPYVIYENLRAVNLFTITIPNNLALAPLLVLAVAGWRFDPFLRRAGWVAVFYIPPVVVAALWWETRLWLPLLMMGLPMALLYLEQNQKPR
jgi:hypothetical protein